LQSISKALYDDYEAGKMKKAQSVLITLDQMKQYRVPLFEKLHAVLADDGVDLRVAYSDPPPRELAKQDNTELPAEYGIKVPGYWFFGHRMLYQPVAREIARADLVIVEQANRYVWNHLLLMLEILGKKRIAFWGHGENKQTDRSRFSEWYKRRILKRADWWFAYTEGVKRYLIRNGVDPTRITSVNNAVDTREIRRLCSAFSRAELDAARRDLGIKPGAPVGIYCGMLHRVKAIDFLLASARLARQARNDFHLILVGGGPEKEAVEFQTRDENWVHAVGPQFGHKKALLLNLSDVLLAPGPVGLVILDAFAAGLPLVTTQPSIHGPEIEYLEEGRNGIMTARDTGAYAQAVVSLLSDRDRLRVLQEGAALSGEADTIENRARYFRQGILGCLDRLSSQGEPASDACKTLLGG
jgi:glycosyltransferase involved in cell wall biosynthesis